MHFERSAHSACACGRDAPGSRKKRKRRNVSREETGRGDPHRRSPAPGAPLPRFRSQGCLILRPRIIDFFPCPASCSIGAFEGYHRITLNFFPPEPSVTRSSRSPGIPKTNAADVVSGSRSDRSGNDSVPRGPSLAGRAPVGGAAQTAVNRSRRSERKRTRRARRSHCCCYHY